MRRRRRKILARSIDAVGARSGAPLGALDRTDQTETYRFRWSRILRSARSTVLFKFQFDRLGPVHRVAKMLGAPNNSVHGPVHRPIYCYARSCTLCPIQNAIHRKMGRTRSGPTHRVAKMLGASSNSVHSPVHRPHLQFK